MQNNLYPQGGTGVPFQRIPDACRSTGLSQWFLRNGCKDGSIPHIMSGKVYLINVPALLHKLGAGEYAHEETK